MRRLLATVLAAALLAPAAALAGPHLRWNACEHDAAARTDRGFACDTNLGLETLVGSLWAPDSIPHAIAFELVIDLASASATFPQWWAFTSAGTCRVTSLAFNMAKDPAWTTCADRYGDVSAGGIAAYRIGAASGSGLLNRARLIAATAVPYFQAFGIGRLSGETYLFTLRINHQKTVAPAEICAGCNIPMCIAFNSVKVVQLPGEGDHSYSGYSSLDSDWFVTWQGGAGIQGECPGAVPTRNSTWGGIKSLYR